MVESDKYVIGKHIAIDHHHRTGVGHYKRAYGEVLDYSHNLDRIFWSDSGIDYILADDIVPPSYFLYFLSKFLIDKQFLFPA